jgi:hypothetical protein
MAHDYDSYYAAPQADNAPPAPTQAAPAAEQAAPAKADDAAKDKDEKSEDDKPTCRWCRCGKMGDPWTLPQPCCLKENNIVVSGWLEGGVYNNQWGASNNGPIGMRSIAGGSFNQAWLSIDRKTDTKGCGWDVGGHVDYVWGTDGPQTQSFGDHSFDYGWFTSSDNLYGSALPQVYGEVAYNDVKVKIGHFYTPIGYEVVQAPQNFFYSHSYSQTFGQPFTHTGVLASWAPNEKVTYAGGWVDGWDEGFGDNGKGSMFLGGFSLNLTEKTTVAWYLTTGSFGNGVDSFSGIGPCSGDLYYNCLVITQKLNDKWTYVFEHDLGINYNVERYVGVGEDNQWYELDNYLIYKINDCWSAATRMEWFQDPEGARVAAGARGNYFAVTAGLNYHPHANVVLRPELRYDWYKAFNGATAEPFDSGTKSTQLSGGVDVIFTF